MQSFANGPQMTSGLPSPERAPGHAVSQSRDVLRIAHVVNTLSIGGAEWIVVALAGSQHRAGHNVLVHSLFGGGPLASELTQAGISVSICGSSSRIGRIRGLIAALQKFSPDVVHCHNVAPTLLGAPLAKLFGARSVICTRHFGARFDGQRLNEAKFWVAARACSYVVSGSESTTERLALGPFASRKRLVTILNGAQAPDIPNIRRTQGQLVLLCIARLAWSKDHETLLRAVAKVRASVPHVQLWLVGDGPRREELEQFCQRLNLTETVRFLGEQRNLGIWLAQADLFVMSSIAEGVPLALLQALSAGLIPITTAAGGTAEIIELSGVGFVVPVSDDSALAASILKALEHRDQWPAWQQQARAAYERHFTTARMCDEYNRLIARSLETHRRSKSRPRVAGQLLRPR